MSMSAEMHTDDVSINCLLTLYLIDHSKGYVRDRMTLTKATFLSQKEMTDRGVHGYVLEFFRYDDGPFSKDLYEIKDILIENGLINPVDFQPTEHGKAVLETFAPVVEASPEVFSCIKQGEESIHGMSIGHILNKVYSIVMSPYKSMEKLAIRDMKRFTVILKNEDHSSIRIGEGALDTLELYCDKNAYEDMKASKDDLQKGNICKCNIDELFCE